MKSQRDTTPRDVEPGVESDALRLSDIAGDDRVEVYETEPHLDEDPPASSPERRTARIVMIGVAIGLAAAAAVGAKIAYDRRKSAHGYRKAAAEYLDDAREALLSAAAELPERGREALQRVTHR
jgi:hypothetical protein